MTDIVLSKLLSIYYIPASINYPVYQHKFVKMPQIDFFVFEMSIFAGLFFCLFVCFVFSVLGVMEHWLKKKGTLNVKTIFLCACFYIF